MKMRFLLIILCFSSFVLSAGDITLNGPYGARHYTVDNAVIMIKFVTGISQQERAAAVSSPALLPYDIQKNNPAYTYANVGIRAGMDDNAIINAAATIAINPNVVYASPMLRQESGYLCAPTNKLFLKLKSPEQSVNMEHYLDSQLSGLVRSITPQHFATGLFKLEFNIKNTMEIFSVAEKLYATGYFIYCEPDFMVKAQKSTDDSYYEYQWSLENTGSDEQYNGTPGADIGAVCAWDYTKGEGTKVAVLDEGVDLTHSDLSPNLATGYDAAYWGGGAVTNAFGGPTSGTDDAHGTNCAGIICAIADNGIGVAGIAPESKVAPVRIFYTDGGGDLITEYGWISDAIEWSVDVADADVLSNSYGLGDDSPVIDDAIDYCVEEGRGGLGSVFVASAGNDNDNSVGYPGKYDNAIGVAASSMCDERKSPTSCDGETFWGSNYGSKLDVAAPGVKIPSTDISGADGYSGTDYFLVFNGTSSAAPATAAVLALIISLDPSLTYDDARYFLENNCEKVGGYPYATAAGHPNGTWVNEMGYGRINACDALEAIGGPALKADLVSGIYGFGAATVSPGETLDVDYYIENTGTLGASSFNNKFLLSDNCTLGGDTGMESFTTTSISAGQTIDYSKTITIPEDAEEGTMNILLQADNGLVVSELTESNNVACGEIYIQCLYSPESDEVSYDFHAVTDSLHITTTSGCEWDITPAPPTWISIINGSETGDGYFIYALEENEAIDSRSYTFNYGPYTYTINQDRLFVGVDNILPGVSIYPNPADEFLVIENNLAEAFYTIMNITGENILSGDIKEQIQVISIDNIPAGVYVIEINAGGDLMRMEFVKN